jgi:hypothetical protein
MRTRLNRTRAPLADCQGELGRKLGAFGSRHGARVRRRLLEPERAANEAVWTNAPPAPSPRTRAPPPPAFTRAEGFRFVAAISAHRGAAATSRPIPPTLSPGKSTILMAFHRVSKGDFSVTPGAPCLRLRRAVPLRHRCDLRLAPSAVSRQGVNYSTAAPRVGCRHFPMTVFRTAIRTTPAARRRSASGRAVRSVASSRSAGSAPGKKAGPARPSHCSTRPEVSPMSQGQVH